MRDEKDDGAPNWHPSATPSSATSPAQLRRASTPSGQGQYKSASNRTKADHGGLPPNVLCNGDELTGGDRTQKLAIAKARLWLTMGQADGQLRDLATEVNN